MGGKRILPGTYVLTRCKCLEEGCVKVCPMPCLTILSRFFFKIRIFAAVYFMWCHKSQIAYWIRWAERTERLELN